MTAGPFRTFLVAGVGAVTLLSLAVRAAEAQERPAPTVEFAVGTFIFVDDGFPSERFGGAAGHVYLSRQISVGPEIAFVQGQNHRHFMVTGNLTCDLVDPGRRVTPFVVVGGGLFQTHENFSVGDFTSTEGAYTAGGGVRTLVGDRVTLGLEVRVGWEAHIRVNGLVGVRLGR
jgi:opacity protein-like surface antigen